MILCSRLVRGLVSLLLLFGYSLVQGPSGPALVPPARCCVATRVRVEYGETTWVLN